MAKKIKFKKGENYEGAIPMRPEEEDRMPGDEALSNVTRAMSAVDVASRGVTPTVKSKVGQQSYSQPKSVKGAMPSEGKGISKSIIIKKKIKK